MQIKFSIIIYALNNVLWFSFLQFSSQTHVILIQLPFLLPNSLQLKILKTIFLKQL